MNAKVSPLDPVLMQTWNKGYAAGQKEATNIFHKFLEERMQTIQDIDGIGEKTAWKIHEHFIRGFDV